MDVLTNYKKSIVDYAQLRNIEVMIEKTVMEFNTSDQSLIRDMEHYIKHLRKEGSLQIFYQSQVQKRRNDTYGFRIVFH
ncbi:hypothetical protein [Catalinimonas niigatensis]|uniref:hypothetical protein n=1 Tax=Catalinimonas niigatensis TaxID=1397264 RepID=UPI00266586E9|nr:hypothetical protein [Catalinimonas niigatensis]WPP50634.1 hypothetical protein PZB72_28635 [Catalinimonas niigatensis]